MDDSPRDDDKQGRFAGWLHTHTEWVWGALAVVFLIYAATSVVSVSRGVLGIDDSNVIGVIGGLLATIAGVILCVTTIVRKHRA